MISIRTGLALAGLLGTLSSCAVAQRIDADRDRLRDRVAALDADLKTWKASHKRWEDAYADLKRIREQERKDSDQALVNANSRCSRDLEAVRTQEEQFRKLFTKPVRFDAKGCPARSIWQASELGLK